MENKDIVRNLKKLFHLDVDAVHAYDQAIKNIKNKRVRDKITEFQADHERHIRNLSEIIRSLNETPPTYSKDFKGYFMKGFTAIRSTTGTEGALKAMQTNEEITNKHYNEAMKWDIPADMKETLKNHFEDEKRHLSYIKQALTDRIWEKEVMV